jgi:hypothetical protein
LIWEPGFPEPKFHSVSGRLGVELLGDEEGGLVSIISTEVVGATLVVVRYSTD